MLDIEIRDAVKQCTWKRLASQLLGLPPPSSETKNEFLSQWIVAGHHIREQIGDDEVLRRLLKHTLPSYTGGSLVLFRGESLQRFELNRVGFAWTTDIEIAKMFARGLNSTPVGGVLLKGQFESDAVICSPSDHSVRLGEVQYTVDPLLGRNIVIVETYPSAF